MGKWRSVWHDNERLNSVGILPDGSLWNPNGYPEDIVRAAIAAAEARQHERRSKAAKKAAATRLQHQEKKTLAVARRLLAGGGIGGRSHCAICGRDLGDPQSIKRGVGSECWGNVYALVALLKAQASAT
jgi:hypothetical protein